MRAEEYPIRTDLALETQEKIQKDEGELKGVDFYQEDRGNGITVSTLIILTENAAKNMGRPRGHYITIEAPEMVEDDESGHREISLELADILRDLIVKKLEKTGKHMQADRKRQKKASEDESGLEKLSILLVGLGNREVTPDALGPRVIDNMFITRHIIKEYGKYAFGDEKISKISGIVPGVMAQTGMECLEIVRGVVKETGPDVVITVDALAARNAKRLGRTIQLTDTGITPGSGVGNHRNALNEKSVGVPVISLGVPTVVDAATIVSDAMNSLVEAMSISNIEKLDEKERQELARELLSPQLNGMFVTPKDIDDSIKRLSFLISEGINIALLGNKEIDTNIK